MNPNQSNELIDIQIHGATVRLPRQTVIDNWLASMPANEPRPCDIPPAIGETWSTQGGVYAGMMRGENGQPDYHLIVPTIDPHAVVEQAEIEEIKWGGAGKEETVATSERDGLANTRALIASDNDHSAARWASNLELYGHRDWYLPARRELALCCATVPELFEKSGYYWSSSQGSANDAWVQGFAGGGQDVGHKDYALRARAVRRFISHSAL